jgi:hypothetical protein
MAQGARLPYTQHRPSINQSSINMRESSPPSSVNYGVMGFTSVCTYTALRRLMGDELDNGKR